jgi:hypothetical protein
MQSHDGKGFMNDCRATMESDSRVAYGNGRVIHLFISHILVRLYALHCRYNNTGTRIVARFFVDSRLNHPPAITRRRFTIENRMAWS